MKSKKNFSEYLSENMDTISNIMDNIESILDDNNINYITNAPKTEIIIKDSNMREVNSLILSLPISNVLFLLLLDVFEVNGKVYVRKKIK